MKALPEARGFSLAELLLAMGLGAFLVTGMVSLAQAVASGYRLQHAQAQLQENARFITRFLEPAIGQAGFRPAPWRDGQAGLAIAPGTRDAFNSVGDRLVLRRWSDRDCFDQANDALDDDGRPRHALLETAFHAAPGGSLVHACRYGPDPDSLVTQVNNLGLAEDVEGLQVQFAEDSDGDGNADRWIRAGQWLAEDRLMGVRFALLLASPIPVGVEGAGTYALLDQTVRAPADGRLRGVFESAVALRGRLR